MTKSQKALVAMSEKRQRLNALQLRGAELTEEEKAEVKTLAGELDTLETEYRAAVQEEDEADAADRDKPEDGETREIRELRAKARLGVYVDAAVNGRSLEGAEKELRQAAFQVRAGGGDQDGVIPWEILEPPAAPPVESRADAPTVAPSGAGAMQDTIVGRVFADTAAAYLGVRMPVQESGDNLQVVIGDGATGATKAKGDGQDAEAASLEVTSLPPRRLTARYVYRVEDKTRLVGLGEALRADLTGALGEALDAATLNGDGSGVNPTGFFAALDTPDDPSEASGMADLLAAAAAAVDGRYALTLRDVRSLVGKATYGLAASTLTAAGMLSAADYLSQFSGGYRTSALIPGPDASHHQAGLTYKGGPGMGSHAVCPMWSAAGPRVIMDEVTRAASGEEALTILMLYNFKVLRADAYAETRFQTQ